MKWVIALLLVQVVAGDIYMHYPRGSNNRLNGAGTNRANNNRLFDSQNNAKGGYCWGPPMKFYGGSRVNIEWTNQHGCGNPNVKCNIVIQYMCENGDMKEKLGWETWEIRDGVSTQNPSAGEPRTTLVSDAEDFIQTGPHGEKNPEDNNGVGVEKPRACVSGGKDTEEPCIVHKFGMHEPLEYYSWCQQRERNRGLFTADQKVGSSARHTRQNPGGGKSGEECPEERDYYPYWHPTPWRDIVVLTDDTSRCGYYRGESENAHDKNYCTEPKYNNEAECEANGGEWLSWNHDVDEPHCQGTTFSRDNHLGNVQTKDGTWTNMYNWTVPNIDKDTCVLRIRYNISTTDYDAWDTHAEANAELSPIYQDPYIEPFHNGRELRLAIDTTQFGRTFQDRSHVFSIQERPSDIPRLARVWNLSVRGKRGNIVQTYPSVEYDFTPTRMAVREGDYVHFQWTGCDTNPNGNDGEGTPGTDRSNIVFLDRLANNHNGSQSFLGDDEDQFAFLGMDAEKCKEDLDALRSSGKNQNQIDQDPTNCAKLNAASRYFDGGLFKIRAHHNWNVYHYMSTRNNNFTNRSQKGTIAVTPFLPVWAIVLVVISAVVLLGSLVYFGFAVFTHFQTTGPIATGLSKVDKTLDASLTTPHKYFIFGWKSTAAASD
eukprot:TRINITY_DN1068_c0_g1_i1.p1 TRINITY_DN1068_c0_g1~~TRINITY_DN1068_c0_g1_i1.p1  ORF type:complete len:655 (-),score=68.67 TRINITY_DN1068_c0_g1_i1:106-2070(-)